MEEPTQTAPPSAEKRTALWVKLLLWSFVILLLYVLSFGPFLALAQPGPAPPDHRHRLNHFERVLYRPWFWTYDQTPLQKPMGIYMHWWTPEIFDKHGKLTKFLPKRFFI